jgi:hypothetical protein
MMETCCDDCYRSKQKEQRRDKFPNTRNTQAEQACRVFIPLVWSEMDDEEASHGDPIEGCTRMLLANPRVWQLSETKMNPV